MAIFQLEIKNQQYQELAKDILKWVSIIGAFCFMLYMSHGSPKNMMKCDDLFEHIALFVLALMFYHLVVCEIVTIT